MVYIPEVDRGRCEFPNVHAVVLEVNDAGLHKLGTKDGELKGYYSRNQFEPLSHPLKNKTYSQEILKFLKKLLQLSSHWVGVKGLSNVVVLSRFKPIIANASKISKHVIPDVIKEALHV